MKVVVNSIVSYNVDKVEIGPLHIFKDKNNALVFQAFSIWLDSVGKTLKQSGKKYTQAELIADSADSEQTALLMAATASLFETGINPMLRVTILDLDNSAQVVSFRADLIDGKNKYTSKTYTESELVEHGLSSAIFVATISQIATALTTS